MKATEYSERKNQGIGSVVRQILYFNWDERGSVLILSGMMVFVVVILCVVTLNLSESYYRRIQVQNAVDAAADSAALWQSRGLNLSQHLNNLHYTTNEKQAPLLYGACCGGCTLQYSPEPSTAAFGHFLCTICPSIDGYQYLFVEAVNFLQEAIDVVFPIVTFLQANVHAEENGADPLLASVEEFFADTSGSVPGLQGIIGNGDLELDALNGIPLFAFPLDPSSLLLNLSSKEGEHYPYTLGSGNQVIAGCGACCGHPSPAFHHEWGWTDDWYFAGVGYMTWVAGRQGGLLLDNGRQDELSGLGALDWLAPNGKPPMKLPPLLGIASSQAEPGVVVAFEPDIEDKGNVGTLIPVRIPHLDRPGTQFGIFH